MKRFILLLFAVLFLMGCPKKTDEAKKPELTCENAVMPDIQTIEAVMEDCVNRGSMAYCEPSDFDCRSNIVMECRAIILDVLKEIQSKMIECGKIRPPDRA